ncbi:LysM domain receptor-like kinase 4 [Linum perenne]
MSASFTFIPPPPILEISDVDFCPSECSSTLVLQLHFSSARYNLLNFSVSQNKRKYTFSTYRMEFLSFVFNLFLCVLSCVEAQQPYIGQGTNRCSSTSDSALGYSCNGVNRTCPSYLTFRAQPPYTTVASISTLLGSNSSQLAAINSVPETASFPTNQLVLVPVTCSCSGPYYQTNTSFVVRTGDNFFFIANQTLQGLSTCQAIRNGNRRSTINIFPGWTLQANGLTEKSATIFPFTTLLIPLQSSPSSNQTVTPPPPPAKSPPPSPPAMPASSSSSTKSWIYAVVGVVGGMMASFAVVGIVICLCFRKRKVKLDPVATSESFETVDKATKKLEDERKDSFLERLSSIAHSMQVYTFEELVVATDNFSSKSWIKGSVYHGKINGDSAAIKKMDGDVSKEINLLNKINHSNIIRLSGVCFNDGYWYLVYEFAANGALSDWMYSSTNVVGKALSWPQRIQIALDVALGLDYLHSFTCPPQVHKDIKGGNVLLDSDFRAKIANLAQARSTEGQDGEFNLTRHIFGTKGYMAPEYLENGMVSTKIDVFAFGVLLLEMITGKEVASLYREGSNGLSNVLEEVVSHAEDGKENNLRQFLDTSMEGNYPIDLAVLILRLVHGCLNKNPANRPAMNELVQSLSRILTASLSWELSNNLSDYRNP